MPPNELDYQRIFKELDDQNIDFLVVGGLAVNFHGIPRMTYDIDLMIRLEPSNIEKAVSVLSNWGYRPRLPVDPRDLANEKKRTEWIQHKNMKAFTFYSEHQPIGEIDLVIDSPIPYDKLKAGAIRIQSEGVIIPVISLPDLIVLKQQAGRKQDLSDVEALKKIREE
jgi:predicted nucleotidyltransferase